MKSALTILAMTISLNTFASAEYNPLAVTTMGPFASLAWSTAGTLKIEAVNTINDAQEALQSGKVSALLSQKIREVKASNNELSDAEALELIVNDAVKILN